MMYLLFHKFYHEIDVHFDSQGKIHQNQSTSKTIKKRLNVTGIIQAKNWRVSR
jgi:hypothetical protein